MVRTLHVIGGGAGIGRWLIDRVFFASGNIFCYDTNKKALETFPNEIVRCHLSTERSYHSYSNQFQSGDWFLLAVPLTAFVDTVMALIPLLKPGSLVITLSSVQAEPIKILKNAVPCNSAYCGFHPLFGPAVSSPVGQLVALTDFDDGQPQHCALKTVLQEKGLIVSTLSAEEHDHYMSYVQALAHFCMIGFAATLSMDGIHPRDLLKLRTPNFHFLYAFTSRVIKLSATTTGAIQSTPEASKIRKKMLESLNQLHTQFEEAATTAECANIIEQLRQPLTGAEVDEGAELASMAADTLHDFEEILYKYKISSSPFVFRHRSSGIIKVIRITEIRHDEILFEEASKLIERNGNTYFAIGLSDTAQKNYRSIGLNMPRPACDAIKKRNIKLLDRDELNAFFRSSVLPMVIDYNFLNPHGLVEGYFEEWLPLIVRGLWHCEFRESFRKRQETEKITLRLTFNPNSSKSEIVERVRAAVEKGPLIPASTRTYVKAVNASDAAP